MGSLFNYNASQFACLDMFVTNVVLHLRLFLTKFLNVMISRISNTYCNRIDSYAIFIFIIFNHDYIKFHVNNIVYMTIINLEWPKDPFLWLLPFLKGYPG